MVKVKVCGITNAADALAAVEAGADALGFNFYARSPRFVTPEEAGRIIARLPETILTVGVFVNEESPEAAARKADAAGVGAIQLHGDEAPAYCAALRDRFVLKALRAGGGFEPDQARAYCAGAILLDAYSPRARGGTGETFDWTLARRTRDLVARLYLAGGLRPGNVAGAIREVGPYGVDVCSGVESAPGRKDAALMRAFVSAVRAAASRP